MSTSENPNRPRGSSSTGAQSVTGESRTGTDQSRRRHKESLCEVCSSLQLSVDRFKVQPSSSSRPRNPSTDTLRSSTARRELGSIRDIRTRSLTCALCALIDESVEGPGSSSSSESGEKDVDARLQDAICSIAWEIDGREAPPGRPRNGPRDGARGLTRRIRVRWSHPDLSDAYLVYVAPETYSRTASDADRVWDKSSLFLGRKIAQHVENQALVKSWLDLCQDTHRGPCAHRDSKENSLAFLDMISHSYFGVIDVRDMQLTKLPHYATSQYSQYPNSYDRRGRREHYHQWDPHDIFSHERYVALSYVWGEDEGTPSYTTTTTNVMLHRTHGGLEQVLQQIPQAIRDAIDLTRRLGYSYLWVDRLCIVQDSARSWKLNAFNMNLIYGNADLTICAADGDASVGLRAIRPASHNTRQCRRTVAPGLTLMATRPPEIYIRASRWNERAWTFQERLLSRRCLVFANGRVYFQCRSTGMSEDIYADRRGAGWSLDLQDAPMQIFRQLDSRAAWVYMKCVELYTQRQLSQSKDILAAFSGMTNLMEKRMKSPFIHGLPSSHFDLALLWEPVRAADRRTGAESGEPRSNSLPDFPSWSWAGWTGPVAYKSSVVGGLLDNVSEWLDKRTWIEWWVRDGHGDLRPLWGYTSSQVDGSKESEWRGYGGSRFALRMARTRYRPRENDQYDPEKSYRFTAPQADGGLLSSSTTNSSDIRHNVVCEADRRSGSGDSDNDSNREYLRADDDDNDSVRDYLRDYDDYKVDDRRDSRAQRSTITKPKHLRFASPEPTPRARSSRPWSYHSSGRSYDRERIAAPPPPPASRSRRSSIPQPRRGYPLSPPSSNSTDSTDRHRSNTRTSSRYHEPSSIYRRGYTEDPGRSSRRPRESSYYNSATGVPPPPTHNSEFYDMFFENGGGGGEEFSITLRDYPYQVVKASYTSQPNSYEFPLLPILQFRTWHTWLTITKAATTTTTTTTTTTNTNTNTNTSTGTSDLGPGQSRCHVADGMGDWCGTVVVNTRWLVEQRSSQQEFVAVSEARSFTLDECPEWTYYVPKEREQSEWDLFYVLLVRRRDEKWERVGLGKVFKEAFRDARWKEIMLG